MFDYFEELTQVTKNNAELAVRSLEKAFESYPLLQYYYPEKSVREKIGYYFLSFPVYSGIKYGEVYATSSSFEGVAVWIPSENYPLTFWKRSIEVIKQKIPIQE